MSRKILALVLLAASMAGCAVNPVTGKPDFMMVSETQELALGEQNYAPMQQAEGGVYDIDPQLTAYVREVGNKPIIRCRTRGRCPAVRSRSTADC
jgi:predicted Zn-dependent protease